MTTTQPRNTDIAQWSPWSEAFPWSTRFGQLVDSMWHAAAHPGELAAGGELEETDDAFLLELDLPGVRREDLTIDITGRRISVHGTRPEREHTGVLRHSTRQTGAFAVEITLPAPVDEKAITATLDNGVLALRMPKASGAKTTRIAIK